MYEDAQKLIAEIVKSPFVVGSINFLKNGNISVKFKNEPRRVRLNSLLEVVELIEIYQEKEQK